VVIDASNGPAGTKAAAVFVEGSRRLLAAQARAGVSHHTTWPSRSSAAEHINAAYYRAKREQERIVERDRCPGASCARRSSTTSWRRGARYGAIPAPRGVLQPVDVDVVARFVAAVALGPPRRDRLKITGPRLESIPALASASASPR
jgi:uncharacterized protein YbjT (DUF2867 family)